jgi:ubiquinone/menaquinone biosynthesis C-methylase UbiE
MQEGRFDVSRFDRLNEPGRIAELRPEKLLGEVAGVQPGMTCVDLGCGTGVFAFPMARLVGDSGKVFAVDSTVQMLDFLRTKAPPPNLVLVQGDVTGTGLPAGIADLCLVAFVLHEINEPARILDESFRLLKPGGKAVIVEWRMESDKGPPSAIRISPEKADELLKEAGFQPGSVTVWSRRHYIVVSNKPDIGNKR